MHLGLGVVSSFLGALPFGIVNLSVVDTTLRRNFRAGVQLSLAASFVEVMQLGLAMYLGMTFVQELRTHIWIKAAIVLLFVGLGLLFFFRKTREGGPRNAHLPEFVRGIILSLINPQALPFWVFMIAWLQSAHLVQFDGRLVLILLFAAGVWLGKLLALLLFGWLSLRIASRVELLGRLTNRVIGAILLLIGCYQGISLFF